MKNIISKNLIGIFTYKAGSPEPILVVSQTPTPKDATPEITVRRTFTALSSDATARAKTSVQLRQPLLSANDMPSIKDYVLETAMNDHAGNAGSTSFALTDYMIGSNGLYQSRSGSIGKNAVDLLLPTLNYTASYSSLPYGLLAGAGSNVDISPLAQSIPPGAQGSYSGVLSGETNRIDSRCDHSVITGGYNNTIAYPSDVISAIGTSLYKAPSNIWGGSQYCIVNGSSNFVSGSYNNVLGAYNFVLGGTNNVLGYWNWLTGTYNTAMGYGHTVIGNYNVSIGYYHTTGSYSQGGYNVTLGGNGNGNWGDYSAIIAGMSSYITSGTSVSIVGGDSNSIVDGTSVYSGDAARPDKHTIDAIAKNNQNLLDKCAIHASYNSTIRSANYCKIVAGMGCLIDGSNGASNDFYQVNIISSSFSTIKRAAGTDYATQTYDKPGASRVNIIGGENNVITAKAYDIGIYGSSYSEMRSKTDTTADLASIGYSNIFGGEYNKIYSSTRSKNPVYRAHIFGGLGCVINSSDADVSGSYGHTKGRNNLSVHGTYHPDGFVGGMQTVRTYLSGALSKTALTGALSASGKITTTSNDDKLRIGQRESYYITATIVVRPAAHLPDGITASILKPSDVAVWKYEGVASRELSIESAQLATVSLAKTISPDSMADVTLAVALNTTTASVDFTPTITADIAAKTEKFYFLAIIDTIEIGEGKEDPSLTT